jgi:flagellar basal-body rod protein FlgB
MAASSMFIDDVVNSGSIPTLELAMRFAGQRQAVISHNIANLETPDFRPLDASPAQFQRILARAIDERRARNGGQSGPLEWRATDEIGRGRDGELLLNPRTPSRGILFHDRNNRDLERLMQDNAENVSAFRVATDMLKSRHDALRAAIAERAA